MYMYIYIICLLAYSLCIHNIYYVYCVWNYTKYCLCDHSMCWQDMQFLIVSTLCCSLIPGIWYLLQCHAIIFSCVCVCTSWCVREECKRTHTHTCRLNVCFCFRFELFTTHVPEPVCALQRMHSIRAPALSACARHPVTTWYYMDT